ncbi:YqaE/Pmp3 family membrane protein [Aquimarina longa]|uniref:YqaE/Pmp3 family membrane protein n=1 Tax=Aquimarina longa TaxID=1080221 RepID=UPI000781FEFB|nr:YqaE/Pmp3 family membrane protein [Aquimarina longa]
MILIAILLPWLSFFLRGKIISGIICLVLQLTLIGWIPEAIWAVASRLDGKNRKRINQMEKRIVNSQHKI